MIIFLFYIVTVICRMFDFKYNLMGKDDELKFLSEYIFPAMLELLFLDIWIINFLNKDLKI